MKGSYSPEHISRWQVALAPYARPAPAVDPAVSALLVIDMQQYFAGIAAPVMNTVHRTVRACRDHGVLVMFTRHGHADPDTDGGALGRWWGDLILEGTDDHRLMSAAGFRPGDLVVPKRRYNAFHGTTLERTLRDHGVEDLTIAGVMTNLCVETTARDAFVRDFRVRVLLDACATASEQMHLASLINLAFGFAHVQTAKQWLTDLGHPRAAIIARGSPG